MVSLIKESNGNDFEWIDVSNPSESELREIAEKYKLHPTSVQDCLDPEHLRWWIISFS
jgi:magnesium transporter